MWRGPLLELPIFSLVGRENRTGESVRGEKEAEEGRVER